MRPPPALLALAALATSASAQDFDPAQRGDIHRSYAFDLRGGAPSTYRLYIPADWHPGLHWPLVVILHGGGGTPDKVFDDAPPALAGTIQREADRHHFLIVAPSGDHGAYGTPYLLPRGQGTLGGPGRPMIPAGNDLPPRALPSDEHATPQQIAQGRIASEADVMNVVTRTIAEYGTDPARTYLMGNSMGGMGTWYLAVAHPGKWCAISPSDGPVDPADYPFARLRALSGIRAVHGGADTLAWIGATRIMVEAARGQGVPVDFVEVPGGTHGASWYTVLPGTFDYFTTHSCGSKP